MTYTFADIWSVYTFLMGEASPPLLLALVYIAPELYFSFVQKRPLWKTVMGKLAVLYIWMTFISVIGIFGVSCYGVSHAAEFENALLAMRSASMYVVLFCFCVVLVAFLALTAPPFWRRLKPKR